MSGEVDVVKLDHSYCKSFALCGSTHLIRPTKYLFCEEPKASDVIDVDIVSYSVNSVGCDQSKSIQFMNENSNIADIVKAVDEKSEEDWEKALNKFEWNKSQIYVFDRTIAILEADHLAKLSLSGNFNEAILRRIHVDRAASKFRHLCAAFYWDANLLQWLHSKLMGALCRSYLISYLDILQTLKCKIPALIDKLQGNCLNAKGNSQISPLNLLLKRPWDPSGFSSHPQKPVVTMKRLSNGPFVFIIPPYPVQCTGHQYSQRMKVWNANLSALGKSTIMATPGVICNLSHYIEEVIMVTRGKIQECRSKNQNRPIILIGWASGALAAMTVASSDSSLTGVVCLGFPSFSIYGKRGDPDDYLLDNKVPVLFVIGHKSTLNNVDEIESMREKMKADSSVVVIPGADDYLCVCYEEKLRIKLTQPMIDSFIMDEIYEFLSSILSSNITGQPSSYFSPAPQDLVDHKKVIKWELKRKLDTEGNEHWDKSASATPKLGRPPALTSSAQVDKDSNHASNTGKVVLSGMTKYLKVGPATSTSCSVNQRGTPSPLFVNDSDSPGIKIANVTSCGRLPIKLQLHPENECSSVIFTPFRGSALVQQGSVTATKYTFPVDLSEGFEGGNSVPVKETLEVLKASAESFKFELKTNRTASPDVPKLNIASSGIRTLPSSFGGTKKILTAVSQPTRMTSSFVFVPSASGNVVHSSPTVPGFVLYKDDDLKKKKLVHPSSPKAVSSSLLSKTNCETPVTSSTVSCVSRPVDVQMKCEADESIMLPKTPIATMSTTFPPEAKVQRSGTSLLSTSSLQTLFSYNNSQPSQKSNFDAKTSVYAAPKVNSDNPSKEIKNKVPLKQENDLFRVVLSESSAMSPKSPSAPNTPISIVGETSTGTENTTGSEDDESSYPVVDYTDTNGGGSNSPHKKSKNKVTKSSPREIRFTRSTSNIVHRLRKHR